MEFVAVTDRGLEDILLMEAENLELAPRRVPGGIAFTGDWHTCMKANLNLRTAVRVLVKAGSIFATKKREFFNKISRLWDDSWPVPGSFSATSEACKIYHTGILTQQAKKAIGSEEGGPKMVIRGFKNTFDIYLDTSGDPLYKRGFGKLRVPGALAENFAAALLLAAGYTGDEPLLDPFCGGGTILMEAALIASGTPPGFRRSFAFESWPEPSGMDFSGLRTGYTPRTPPHPIIGLDREEEAVATATVAQSELGIPGIQVYGGDACSIRIAGLPRHGLVASNMPYDRLTRGEQRIYSCFGERLRDRLRGWRVALIVPDDRVRMKLLRQKFTQRLKVSNHGIPVVMAIGSGTGN